MLKWVPFSAMLLTISAFLNIGYESEDVVIKETIMRLSEKHFSKGVTLIIYSINSTKLLIRPSMNSLAKALMKRLPCEISNENYEKPTWDRLMFGMEVAKASNIIILLTLNDVESVKEQILHAREGALWNSQAKIVIIFKSSPSSLQVVNDIFDTVWTLTKSLNVLLVGLQGEPVFFINYPFSNCFHKKILSVNISTDDVFPLKIPQEFGGCDINVGTVVKEPYTLDPNEPLQYSEGVEVRLLRSIAELKQFKLKFKESPKGENPYLVYDKNNHRVGLLGLLYRHEADIACFGVGLGNDRFYAAEALHSHTEDILVWAVPSSEKGTNWDSVYIGFSKEIWVTVFMLLISIAITFRLLTMGDDVSFQNFSKCLLDSWSATLNLGVTFSPRSVLLKLFMVVVLIYGIIITSAYQCFLVTLLTAQRQGDGIRTIEDAVNRGLLAYLAPSGTYMYNQSKHDMWNKILSKSGHTFETNYTLILSRIAKERNAISMMIKNSAEYVVRKRYMSSSGPLVKWLSPYFTNYPVTCYMAPGHPLKEEFNKNIRRLVEAGIPTIWLNKILEGAESRKDYLNEHDDSHKPLSYRNLEVTLIILGTGLISSLVIFFIEILISHVKVEKWE